MRIIFFSCFPKSYHTFLLFFRILQNKYIFMMSTCCFFNPICNGWTQEIDFFMKNRNFMFMFWVYKNMMGFIAFQWFFFYFRCFSETDWEERKTEIGIKRLIFIYLKRMVFQWVLKWINEWMCLMMI